MTEEIKEILDYWQFYINESNNYKLLNVHFDEIKKVLDYITNLQKENEKLKEDIEDISVSHFSCFKRYDDYKSRNEKAVESAKEKIKRYESYIHDLKNGNYPSPTVRQERQELIFRIREQEDLLNILEGGDE